MNAGAFDGEISRIVDSVTILDEEFQQVMLPASQLHFSYRNSIFQEHEWIILGATLTLRSADKAQIDAVMNHNMQHRIDKQPLEYPSAGSAFKRPKGNYASALIDKSGLRGYRVGGAAISEKHCGFIVNLDNASSSDVLQLADDVVKTVQQKTGYLLEKEIRVIKPADSI